MLSRTRRILVAALLGIGATGAGCATNTGTDALIGTGAGALAGMGVGSIHHSSAGIGTAIGAGVGALAGGLYGNEMDKKDQAKTGPVPAQQVQGGYQQYAPGGTPTGYNNQYPQGQQNAYGTGQQYGPGGVGVNGQVQGGYVAGQQGGYAPGQAPGQISGQVGYQAPGVQGGYQAPGVQGAYQPPPAAYTPTNGPANSGTNSFVPYQPGVSGSGAYNTTDTSGATIATANPPAAPTYAPAPTYVASAGNGGLPLTTYTSPYSTSSGFAPNGSYNPSAPGYVAGVNQQAPVPMYAPSSLNTYDTVTYYPINGQPVVTGTPQGYYPPYYASGYYPPLYDFSTGQIYLQPPYGSVNENYTYRRYVDPGPGPGQWETSTENRGFSTGDGY